MVCWNHLYEWKVEKKKYCDASSHKNELVYHQSFNSSNENNDGGSYWEMTFSHTKRDREIFCLICNQSFPDLSSAKCKVVDIERLLIIK